ncbi:hypothetical protein ACRGNN_004159 [Providencia stuartii]|uniref:hypothetical protein n=1 Tax=Providencia stuartii TaxID=588 RepID=UPI0018C710C7|nr:hypothetical protein [Providencia stuartii]EMD1718775.1 hypothetical protein [Providencia stuartii]MBG5908524.1 hypothetical protein [Providencia stuartii]WAZ73459.1 hypothetical protein O4Z98_12475 [Providencia stuartii]HEM6895256.1 hypothetical protein [Providencia stuartii]
MSIESELAYLKASKSKVLEFINETPVEHVICLASWKSQLAKLDKKINKLEQRASQ